MGHDADEPTMSDMHRPVAECRTWRVGHALTCRPTYRVDLAATLTTDLEDCALPSPFQGVAFQSSGPDMDAGGGVLSLFPLIEILDQGAGNRCRAIRARVDRFGSNALQERS